MLNQEHIKIPLHFEEVKQESELRKFTMLSDLKTGSLLRSLAASKSSGKILELGTGTGLSLTWIAEGADNNTEIISIDNSLDFQAIAKRVFAYDDRIRFECLDANIWLKSFDGEKFDLIFADAFPGKFENLEYALNLVKIGGFYVIDDLFPQPNWPENHQINVDKLLATMYKLKNFVYTPFDWSTGLVVFTRIA